VANDIRFGNVKLSWVVHEGLDVHVSEFEGVLPKDRPEVSCPECNGALTLRLGSERAWHAAHQTQRFCWMSNPETALHHNTKMYLAEQLRRVHALDIVEHCGSSERLRALDCQRRRIRPWLTGWDTVAVERRVNDRRPDIVLLQDGRPIAAIEVWVSHRVEPEKRHMYAEWRLPWIEVDAHAGAYERPHGWSAAEPLGIARLGPEAGFVCHACVAHAALIQASELASAETARLLALQAQLKDERANEAARKVQEAEALAAQQRNAQRATFAADVDAFRQSQRKDGIEIRRILAFDLFAADGRSFRDVMVIADVWRDGAKVGAFLGTASDQSVLVEVGAGVSTADYVGFDEVAKQQLEWMRTQGCTVDAPDRWFNFEVLLTNEAFVSDWQRAGIDHTWPDDGAFAATEPWRRTDTAASVDALDLLRYFLVRYVAGLPIRYFATKDGRWFQPPILREEVWRLWPDNIPRVQSDSRALL
jgi:hypothetical protein